MLKCKHKAEAKRKIQNSMSFLESTNFTLMAPKENDFEDLLDKKFKRLIITIFKQLKDDMPSL